MHTVSRLARCLCIGIGLVAASGEASAERILTVRDEGTGQTEILTAANARFSMAESDGVLNIAVEAQSPGTTAAFIGGFWFLKFAAPPGEKLLPGAYTQARCPGFYGTGRAPALEVTENNPLCASADTVWGEFAIRQIDYDPAGKVRAVELTFSQRRGSDTAPALSGELRMDTEPLSLTVDSPAGFAWGKIAQTNHGDTSLFTLTGTSAGLDYTASVIKDFWSIGIEPPVGMHLEAGRTYATRNFPDRRNAGLLLMRGLPLAAQTCGDATGRLHVRAMETGPGGEILGLHADFEYKCALKRPPLRGTIRYHL